jgi:hypothetical protein
MEVKENCKSNQSSIKNVGNKLSSINKKSIMNKKYMQFIEKDLENVHFIQMLESIAEEDEEEFITINLQKKTIKKLLRNLKNENGMDRYLFSAIKCELKDRKSDEINQVLNPFDNELFDNIFPKKQENNEMYKAEVIDDLKLMNLNKSELNLTNDQLVKLFKRFKSDLDGKNQSMKFEIDQILDDLNNQFTLHNDSLYKRYNKYVSY